MIRTARAAAFAAAAFLMLATSAWSDPLQAGGTAGPPDTVSYMEHDGAATDVSDIGINGDSGAGESEALTSLADHLLAMADSAIPRPHSLGELVDAYGSGSTQNGEQDCLASAVYFESRGEPIEGQLAVAEVVLNRTRSGRYPAGICAVVTQAAQFSFVRHGTIPTADRASEAWRKAVAIARIAQSGATRLLPSDVLWYHANYVSPSWGRRLARNARIGLHIFYS